MYGLHHENRVDHVANSNLVAAATDGVFEPLTVQEHAWFSGIETFDDMSESDSFEQLVTLQPTLRDFEWPVLREAPDLWPAASDPDNRQRHRLTTSLRAWMGWLARRCSVTIRWLGPDWHTESAGVSAEEDWRWIF